MNRHMPLVSAITLALVPAALQATTLDPSSGPVVGTSPQRSQSDAMAEALARVGLYRYSTRYQTVVKPSAPIYVAAPAPAVWAPSAPPPPAADCESAASTPAPAVASPVAPVVFLDPPAPPVAPAAASPFPTEPAAPALPSSQERLQNFFIQVLGARSRLKVVNVTAAPVVISAPAPVVVAPVVAQVAPKSAGCAPKGDSSPPAGAPAMADVAPPALLADFGIASLQQDESGEQGQSGSPDSFGDDPADWLIDPIDPVRGESLVPMAFAFDGPEQFSLDFEDDATGRVPEPGSLALLGLGLMGLGLSRRRTAAR